jgi:cbb3-type cytochrome oxidase subunit 3
MSLAWDIILGGVIGTVYSVFIYKLGDILSTNCNTGDRTQSTLIIMIVMGIIAMGLAVTIFNNHKKAKNRAMRYGLVTGGLLLLFYALVINWDILGDNIKVIIMGIILVASIWYVYKRNKKEKKHKKNDYK